MAHSHRTMHTTVKTALSAAQADLAAVTDSNPRLDAEILLAFVLGRDRTWLYTRSDRRLTPGETAAYRTLITRRRAGIPIAHLVGEREFWSLRLRVTPDTLIPRPDTETLVEQALELIVEDELADILDLGTGSGAIALALGHERRRARVIATDLSCAALRVARSNATRLRIENVAFLAGTWYEPLADYARFDLIASNPPYIAAADPHLVRGDVAHEPRSALAAGADGLDDLAAIIDTAPRHLKAGGWLLVEHGENQGEAVRALLNDAEFDRVTTRKDLGDRDRVSFGRRPASKIP